MKSEEELATISKPSLGANPWLILPRNGSKETWLRIRVLGTEEAIKAFKFLSNLKTRVQAETRN